MSTGYRVDIAVSRRKAFVFGDEGKVDIEGKYTLFGQAITQILSSRPDLSNFCQTSPNDKCFDVRFKGEGSQDAGGPFRELFVNIASELMSPVLPLLIKSPNNRNEFGSHRDCYILNCAALTPATQRMYKMLGAFIGFSFLTK